MKRILVLSVLALSIAAVAMPAFAQGPRGGGGGGHAGARGGGAGGAGGGGGGERRSPGGEQRQERREERREKHDGRRGGEQRQTEREQRGGQRKPEGTQSTEGNKERPTPKNEQKREASREKQVDRRQDRQEKRIEHGVEKGYLTNDEVAKLESQQKQIADLEQSYKTDGKLSRDECKDLNKALNDASAQIWAQKHDTEGNQMPVYRLGKNVFAKDDLTSKIENDNISSGEAKQALKDFHETLRLQKALSTEDLSPEQRAVMQSKFNGLLNQYFIVKDAAT